MVEIITDTQSISISVIQHADCKILNLVYPASIEPEEEFDITYDCKNNGVGDTCFGTLKGGSTIYDHWEETIGSGGTVSKVVNFPDGITENLNATLDVGYVK